MGTKKRHGRMVAVAGFFAVALTLLALGFLWQQREPRPVTADQNPIGLQVRTVEQPLSRPDSCSDTFVTHRLDFATGMRLREIGTYISNGAGVAANDLDGDGDLDLVFASVDRESAILWNQGDLRFQAEPLDDRFTRGVAVVDVDGDGALDITFTHRGLESVSFWRNLGPGRDGPRFQREPLPGVEHYAYAMAWGDLNGDNRLDLVTGSYAAELIQHGIAEPAQDERAGLVLHLQQPDGSFNAQVLDTTAETLSIGLVDLLGDHRPEIWVANDFSVRDQLWRQTDAGWQERSPFRQTSHSTMSLEWGDVFNRDDLALFTTDMSPYDIAPATLAQWVPVMDEIEQERTPGDPQIVANVFLTRSWLGWRNRATFRGVDATGWSWAGRMGDLDADGHLDLYVVNGMIAADLFDHLPNHELVEENQAFRNRGNGIFDPMPGWGLGSTASGRGMIMADMDGDGDLDIVVNNLRNSAQLFENQLCGGEGLMVSLEWPGAGNSQAVGGQLRLQTDMGLLQRDVRASGGYLSGDAAQVHFGLPAGSTIDFLEIRWPDGAVSRVDDVQAGKRLTVIREEPS